jgi:hypothetical protein
MRYLHLLAETFVRDLANSLRVWTPRLALRCFISVAICVALQLALSQLGQVADLRRAINEDLNRRLFTSMAFLAISGFSLALCIDGLARHPQGLEPGGIALSLALAAGIIGPATLALSVFGSPCGIDAGTGLALLAAVLMPAGICIRLWFDHRQLTVSGRLRTLCGIFAVMAFSLLLLLLVAPAFWSLMAGAMAVFFVVVASLLWPAWFLVTRRPGLAMVLVVVLGVLAAMGAYGVREARTLAGAPDGADRRPDALAHATAWLEARRSEITAMPAGKRYPVFFVTSDGGGVRAALWTTEVLGALADDEPRFSRQLYLLSGVSGGSVGVATFAARVAETPEVLRRGGFRATSRAMLAQDFVAVPTALMLTRDPFESVFCYGMKWRAACSQPANDRVIALESILEGAWVFGLGSHRFEQDFLAMWDGVGDLSVPALILNTTDADSGRPRIVSSTKDAAFGPDLDVLAALPKGRALRLSTAVMLSARFPVISPVAELHLTGGRTDHLVDGGYFDNSGSASAELALPAFLQAASNAGLVERIEPVALMITNDVRRRPQAYVSPDCTPLPLPEGATKPGVGAVIGQPLSTLDAERAIASEARRSSWMAAMQRAQGQIIELSLFDCQQDHDFEVPLGWSLSAAARRQLQGKLDRLRFDAHSPFWTLLDLLRPQ